ncbi:MAG TPA: hypothetical protein DIT19_01570 [Desulfonauticus sp.]|nr:MAG: hypothetical protein XD41_1588 [Desulfonauticus sp. 38_4375]HCO11903.1 hypothetical protein [Desulfonauticus sp.]
MQWLNYFAIGQDYEDLLQFVQDIDLLAIPKVLTTEDYNRGKQEAVPPVKFQLKPGEEVFYLIPKSVPLTEGLYTPMKYKPALSYLLPHQSPVIELGKCQCNGKKVYSSEISILFPENEHYSNAIYKAFNKIHEYVQKWPQAEYTYIGPETYKLVQNKEIEIIRI